MLTKKKNAWDFQCHVISGITEVNWQTVPQSQQETLKHAEVTRKNYLKLF